MAEKWVQHIGDDQLVYGMPKHTVGAVSLSSHSNATANEKNTYWKFNPKPKACDKCQAMEDVWFERKPEQIHPNCKCEIEQFEAISTDAAKDIIVPPNVDIEANLTEARRKSKECNTQAEQYIYDLEAKAKRYVSWFLLPDELKKASVEKMAFHLKCIWILDNFGNKKKFDYKQIDRKYQAFGNYHYGLYTNAMGINKTFAQIAAGYAQVAAGTSERSFYRTWFDDPADNAIIKKGQNYPMD